MNNLTTQEYQILLDLVKSSQITIKGASIKPIHLLMEKLQNIIDLAGTQPVNPPQ
jgi:hypothetical protein